ncbi:hypothetical protein WR25_09856 [Diploscapter pachys]|uniref:Hepatocyte growth factor-regulated tyrosine kinase substrate helical domain-containing protein n=1 Tax=Diploscapter pachys TaxID=2018661 RepID=A0A2A2JIK6_9BILA|nr:hypothetical protein WR25_09856 [Diploscapter pachys]
MALPQFGIEKEVRVCDACFEKVGSNKKDPNLKGKIESVKSKPITNEVSKEEKEKALREKEEEELALALAISQSEAEAKEMERQRSLYSIYNGMNDAKASSLPAAPNESFANDNASVNSYNPSEIGYRGAAQSNADSDGIGADDPLARYLNRDYWQNKKATAGSSVSSNSKVDEWASIVGATAPLPSVSSLNSYANTVVGGSSPPRDRDLDLTIAENSITAASNPLPVLEPHPALSEDVKQQTEGTVKWCQELKDQVTVMENRIRSNTARGRPVVNDTAIQGLFMKLTELHAQVLSRMGKLDEDRTYYESLQDHLGHINESRLAVNALRDEHNIKKAERLAEEQRVRQEQMRQTLEIMRMKKHAMLLEQREQALQKFQAQEMAARRPQPYAGYAMPGYAPQQYGHPAAGYPGQMAYPQGQQPSTPVPGQPQTQAQGQVPTSGLVSQQNIPGYATPTHQQQQMDGEFAQITSKLSASYTQQPGQFPGQPPASQAPSIASGVQSSASSTSLSNSAIAAQQPPAAFPPMSYSNPTVPAQASVVTSTPEKNQAPPPAPAQILPPAAYPYPVPQHYPYMFPGAVPQMGYAPMPMPPNGMPFPPHSYAQPQDASAQPQAQLAPPQPVVEEAPLISFD